MECLIMIISKIEKYVVYYNYENENEKPVAKYSKQEI